MVCGPADFPPAPTQRLRADLHLEMTRQLHRKMTHLDPHMPWRQQWEHRKMPASKPLKKKPGLLQKRSR